MVMRIYLLLSFFLCSVALTAQTWNLVWSDEFNGTSLNTDVWTYDLGTGSQFGLNGWGNNELQYYTNSTENVFVSGGNLHIVAKQQNVGGMNYTSGRIRTVGNAYWTYGKIEARMKLPTGQGIWPAFWMLREAGIWPGEIDIMETVGNAPNTLHGTCHQGTAGNVYSLGGSIVSPSSLTDNFHTYSIEWFPDNIRWFLDGQMYYEVNRSQVTPNFEWLFDEDYYMLLNVAVGGNWPGAPNGTTVFPQEMVVDYVRAYQYTPMTVPVTFRVDMSEETLNPGDIVYVNGAFNSWCGTCNPMINTGNGIWTITLPLPPGLHEYKYTTNGWDGLEEQFSEGQLCTITTYGNPSNFVNRYANIAFTDVTLPLVCFNSCASCVTNTFAGCTDSDATNYDPGANTDDGSCVYATTFRVNTSELGLLPTDVVHLNSTFNGWCGTCNPMIEAQPNEWETTVNLPVGNHEYKFTVNGWSGEIEMFDIGAACTLTTFGGNGEVFTNRIFTQLPQPMALNIVCFNSCETCAATSVDVTFRVDVEGEAGVVTCEVTPEGQAQQSLTMNHEGWGLWTVSITLQSGDQVAYHFEKDGVSESATAACFNAGERSIAAPAVDVVLPIECFGSCGLCVGCNDPLQANFNPFAIGDQAMCSGPMVLGCTYDSASNYNPNATTDDGQCVWEANACPEDISGDGVVNAQDLLTFLSAFGTYCD
ncbi:MAG: family 16 glycosylhydrolase [Cryomorphaceae bacterium]|nr:family 16 glycosylhydrolase [Cryomorphaceae bacterium]